MWGVTREEAERAFGGGAGESADGNDFEIWPENAAALEFFLELSTQWRAVARAAGVVIQGIGYADIEACMRLRGIRARDRAGLFLNLRIMERAALQVMNDGSRASSQA